MKAEPNTFVWQETEKVQDFFLQPEQDGLFFGLEFLNHLFASENFSEKPELRAYFQDGDCVFKGQTILGIHLYRSGLKISEARHSRGSGNLFKSPENLNTISIKDNSFQKENILSAVSYLSGVYTLVSCFTERQWDFPIIGSLSTDFPFPEWERKAILKAGGLAQKIPEKMCCSQEEILQFTEKRETKVILNCLEIPIEESKKIVQDFPEKEFSLYGPFFPEDLEEFRDYNISSVHPLCLQGSFPCLKMSLKEFKT